MAVNRLTLRVSVQFDKAQLKKETLEAQKKLNKAYSDNLKRQDQLQKKNESRIRKNNKGLKEEATLYQKITGAIKKQAIQVTKILVVAGAIRGLLGILREAISLAFELDTAFTNFSIVSQATASELAGVNAQVDSLTLELGKLKKEVIDTVTEFNRAGFSIQESLTLAENAIKGANVGATSLSNVTTFLVAGLKSFNLEAEDSVRILDVLFKVANTTAINLEGIGEAFLRSANTLQTAGASLEESAALIAGANESIQDPAKVGTALKTIASRLRGVSEDGEAIPKLAESFNAVGISIQEADGSFRNIFDIFQDLARILPTLDELTRESLLEKLAGKRQKNIIIGLLNNFDTAEQALLDALNSTGEVAQANEKFLESLQGRTNQLREAWNQLLQTFTDSDGLKDSVTALKDLLVFINQLIQKTPKAIFLVGGLALALAPFGTAVTIVGGLVSALAGIGIASDLSKTAVDKLTDSVASLDNEIASLDQKINNLEGIQDRTEAEEALLDIYREQLDAKKRLRAIEAESLAVEQLKEAKELIEDLVDVPVDQLTLLTPDAFEYINALEGVEETLEAQEKQLLKTITASSELLNQVDEESKAFKTAKETFDLATEALRKNTEQQISLGFRVAEVTNEADELNDVIIKQATLFTEASNLADTASEEYKLLSDALQEIQTSGALSDEVLNTLIDTFGRSILQTGLAEEAFKNYVDSNKAKTIEEIERLQKLAEAEIETTKAILNSRKALEFLSEGTDENLIFAQAEALIANAENSIVILENERKQIVATEKARIKATETKVKESKVLTDLENRLNKINAQIEFQQKLSERTEGFEEQIKINERLVGLYEQQKDALIEQQIELQEQGKSLEKGTEAYDDYVKASFDLSLAIEDATNSIFKYTKANEELIKAQRDAEDAIINKELAEELEKSIDGIVSEIERQIQVQKDLAKENEEYFDDLIKNKEKELDALKKANEERENQIELEKLLQNLQDLRERRANILGDETVRIVKDADVGFENIADPRELKKVEEDIKNAEDALTEFREDLIREENEARLQAVIDGLEEQKDAEQEAYDYRIEELERFQDITQEVFETSSELQQQTVAQAMQNLGFIEQTSYVQRLQSLTGFVNEYNRILSAIEAQRQAQQNAGALGLPIPTFSPITPSAGFIDSTLDAISGSTDLASLLAGRLAGQNGDTSNTNTNINNLNLNTDADSLTSIIEDALRQAKLL